MKTQKTGSRNEIIATLTVLAVIVAGGLWVFMRKTPPQPESYVAIVVDASPTNDPTSRCEDIGRLAEEAAQHSKGALHLTLFSTGDRASGYEGTRVGTLDYQPGTRILEGTAADEESRQTFFSDVKKLCAQLPNRKESPIFRAVSAAVKTMPAEVCQREKTTCEVVVRTDGIEEEDARVMSALHPTKRSHKSQGEQTEFEPRIANHGVAVRFCALVARQIGKNAAKLPTLDAVERAFRREFTSPEHVRFEPACVAYSAAK